jgi:hypothetical protein
VWLHHKIGKKNEKRKKKLKEQNKNPTTGTLLN